MKIPTLDVKTLVQESLPEFSDSVTPNFKEVLNDPDVEQHIAGIVMGAIIALMEREDTKALIGDFMKIQLGDMIPHIPGMNPKTPEEQAKITENVGKITKEIALGMIDQEMPPFAAGILDKKVEGWREILGDSPETLAGVANFFNQIGLKAKGEDMLQKFMGGLTGGGSTSHPGAHRSSGGVR